MRGTTAAVALVLVAGLGVAGCSGDEPEPDRPGTGSHAAPAPDAELGATEVRLVDADEEVEIAASPVSVEQAADLEQTLVGGGLGGLVGPVLEVSTADGGLEGRVELTRRYPVALPEGAVATFAHFDEALGSWVAVPSELSDDRTAVAAIVDHLSLWTDVVAGTEDVLGQVGDAFEAAGEAVTDGVQQGLHAIAEAGEWTAGWLFYAVGKVFDTRVDAPTCTSPLPTWVDSTQQVEPDENNPILWCAGQDRLHPELLTVKARVNRGFGFPYTTAVQPRWRHNSSFDRAHELALDALIDQASFYAETVELLGLGPGAVDRGGELSMGFSEGKVRGATGDRPLVQFRTPSAIAFLASVAAGLTGQAAQDQLGGWLGTAASLGQCARDVAAVDDVLAVAKAALTCVGAADEAIAQRVAVALLQARPGTTPAEAGKTAGGLVGRVTIYLALVGPVFSSMNYVGELLTDDAVRELSAYPTTIGPTEVVDLNPFDADGAILPPYTLDDQRGLEPLDCSYGTPAIGAHTPGTHWCGTTADNAHECWAPPTFPDALVCMATPWDTELTARSAVGLTDTPVPDELMPMGLELADGSRWWVRSGGSWGGRADGLVGAYGCDSSGPCPEGEVVLLVASGTPAVDMAESTWYVLRGELGDPSEEFPAPERLPVATAYFIASTF